MAGTGRPRRLVRLLAISAALALLIGGVSTALWLGGEQASRAREVGLVALVAGVIVTVALTTVNLSLRWLRWHFLLRALGVRPPARESAHLFVFLLPAILTPFAVGELSQIAALRRWTARPARAGLLAWLLARGGDVGALALLIALGDLRVALALLVLLAAIAAAMIAHTSVRDAQASWPTTLGVYVGLSIAGWVPAALSIAAVSALCGAPIDPLAAMNVFARATLLGGVTGSPGGMATTGAIMIGQLEALGVATAIAAGTALAVRVGTSIFSACVGAAWWAARWREGIDMFLGRASGAQAHFDELAPQYAEEIPPHVRERLLGRKIALMETRLASLSIAGGGRGLDLGCGHGWYALDMAARGWRMDGCDLTPGQVAAARDNAQRQGRALNFAVASVDGLPYADGSFDFVYSVNVLHHVTDEAVRAKAWQEIVRVLKPGGVFLLHEMNTRNPLFRLYMSYLFPLLNRIDDGTEKWLLPHRLPDVAGARWSDNVEYITFLPDFVPGMVMRPLLPLERWLEGSRLRIWSAHYMAALRKGG